MATTRTYYAEMTPQGLRTMRDLWIEQCTKERKCTYTEAFHACQIEEPVLIENHEKLWHAIVEGTEMARSHLDPAERAAVVRVLDSMGRDEAEYFQAGADFSAAALSICRQIDNAALSVLDCNLIQEQVQNKIDMINDPKRAMPGTLMQRAGLGGGPPYKALPGGTGAALSGSWEIGPGRTPQRKG